MTPREWTAQAVADLVGGRLIGTDGVVRSVAPLESADHQAVSLLVSGRFRAAFRDSRAGVVLMRPVDADLEGTVGARILVEDPAAAMAQVVECLYPLGTPSPGVHPSVVLGEGVRLGRDVSLGPRVVLECGVRLGDRVVVGAGAVLEADVEVGDDSVVGPGVICARGTRVGRRVRLKAGAVLGGEGFGYSTEEGEHRPVRHVGRCLVGDDVDVGSNSCIDRGSIGDTVVGDGTKIDNLVHVGHNVHIGRRCLLMAGVGVAGSTIVEDDVILAGHVGVSGHLRVGAGARVGAGSKVWGPVPSRARVSGLPARPHLEFLRAQVALARLTPLLTQLEALAKERHTDG